MNLNKIILVGRTTKKPEIKTTQGGQSVTSFSIATSRNWTDKAGQKQEQAEFHNVVLWGKSAELVCQYIDKGQLLLVEGRLQTRSWQDKNGGKRQTTEIVGERVQFGPKPAGSGANFAKKEASTARVKAEEELPPVDDIPF